MSDAHVASNVSVVAAGWCTFGALLGGFAKDVQGGNMHASVVCSSCSSVALQFLQAGLPLVRCWVGLERKHRVATPAQLQ
jgi:hypothetical protein